MFCQYCGKEMPDDMRFCQYCGREVIDPEKEELTDDVQNEAPAEDRWPILTAKAEALKLEAFGPDSNEEKKASADEDTDGDTAKKTNKKAIIIAVSAVLAVALGVGLFLIFGGKAGDVDLETLLPDDVVVGYEGFAEVAETRFGVDKDKAEILLASISNDKKKAAVAEVLNTVEYSCAEQDRLSNGDIVEIIATYDTELADENGVTVSNDRIDYVVENLEEGEDVVYGICGFEDYRGDFVLPDSYNVVYSIANLTECIWTDQNRVQQAINELYARHGMIFEDVRIYDNCKWYIPAYPKDEFKESWFSSIEKTNLNNLIAYRDKLKKAKTKCDGCGKTVYKNFDCCEIDGEYFCSDCFDPEEDNLFKWYDEDNDEWVDWDEDDW